MLTISTLGVVSTASAQTSTATLVYRGTNAQSRILGDSGLIYIDGCSDTFGSVFSDDPILCLPDDFPGTLWGRVGVGIDTTVVTAQSADFSLNTADSFRQDTSATFTTTLVAKDADGKEVTVKITPFVFVDIAYDAPPANCPKSTIQNVTELENANTDGCLNIVYHNAHIGLGEFTVLDKDTTLPYTGSKTVTDTKSSPGLDIGALAGLPSDLLGVRLDFVTDLVLNAVGGYTANRVISSSSDPSGSLLTGAVTWTSANPQDETIQLPCTIPAGDNLTYRLTNNMWDGTATATSQVQLVITNPISDIGIPLVTGTVFDGLVQANANNYSTTLGQVLAENKPPTVALAAVPTNGVEGSPIAFAIVGTGPGGSFDNCDPTGASLGVHWRFDDGGTAFGKSVSHAFADNNGLANHLGDVIVTDASNNASDRDFSVAVANVAPGVSAGVDKTADWGRSVSFHANGSDAGAVDRLHLLYDWNFNDPSSPVGAAGQSVSHVFSNPGTYQVVGSVNDKDGASGSDTVQVTVTKRSTTAYTGQLQSVRNKYVNLSAQVTDEYGQAVAGKAVTFTIGTQTATGTADGTGIARATLKVIQANGKYTLTARLGTNSHYEVSSTSTTFLIGSNPK